MATKLFIAVVMLFISYNFILSSYELNFLQDDAFTSFRYAKNFAEGNGLVFNENERVEGYTNFIWVILLSGFFFLDKTGVFRNDITSTAQILSTAFGVASIWITFFITREFLSNYKFKLLKTILLLIPPFIVSQSLPFHYWSISGMETTLFISVTLLLFLFYLKNIIDSNLGYQVIGLSILNTLIRPEGIIFFGLVLLHKLFGNYKSQRNSLSEFIKFTLRQKLVKEVLFYLIFLTALTLFRIIYFGYPLPNTYYAKTEFSTEFLIRGIRYFWEFASTNLLYGLMLIIPLLGLVKVRNRKAVFLLWIIFSWIILIVFIGGDVLPVHRFFLPVFPLIIILNLHSLVALIETIKRESLQRYFSILLIILFLAYSDIITNRQRNEVLNYRDYEAGLVTKMKVYADWLKEKQLNADKKIIVAASTIGALSYYSQVNILDLVGLTDEYIAHNPKEVEGIDQELPILWKERKYNVEYVLSKEPDYILFPAGAKPSAFAECALFVQKEFYENYFMDLIYSKELNQLLPIFSRRQEKLNVDNTTCEVSFVKHYINANNLYLELVKSNSSELLSKIFIECYSIDKYCSNRTSLSNSVRGMAYYQIRDNNKAKEFFENSLKSDSLSNLSRFYLKNIYLSEGDSLKAIQQISFLKKYSPGLFEQLD